MPEQRWPAWCRPGKFGPLDVNLDQRMARMYGATTPCEVVVDPAGDYLGWIDAADERTGRPAGTSPVMIHHKQIFEIQFPAGSAASVAKGHGEVVRLRIEVDQ
ncbi:hypothetical protein SEA_MORGANA_169 [Gordonia phage Morgana]|uniref:Head-to-tail stopper n=1 Tax=Gordonia phage Morgana TaxID=3137292 RepID=A0AAX4RCB8_9CAUD